MEPGHHKGRHYTEWVEEVKALKRAGRLDNASRLLQALIVAVEEESRIERWTPAPWYYEQLAIIRRKQKDQAGEESVLRRYIAASMPYGAPRAELLARLNTLR
jgi:hypothetical protein